MLITSDPRQYMARFTLKNEKEVLIRMIRPEDEALMVRFHQTLSEESVYYRYLYPLKLSERIDHECLRRICHIDCEKEIALVAEYRSTFEAEPEILGVGRLSKLGGADDAEFALAVSNAWQNLVLPGEVLKLLVAFGQRAKLRRILGHILPENHTMQHVCRKARFKLEHDADRHDHLAVHEGD